MTTRKIIAGAFLSLFLPSVAFAAFSKTEWQFEKPISVPAAGTSQYVKADLDSDVSGAVANFADVRVLDARGTEVPYQLVTEAASQSDSYYSSKLSELSTDSSGRTSFVLDLGTQGVLHDRLSITSSTENFKRQVSVYASDSLLPLGASGWRLLSSDGHIYAFTDRTAGFHAGNGEVSYPDNTSR